RDLRKGIVDDLELMKRPDWMLTLTTYLENGAFDFVVKPGFNPSIIGMDNSKFSMLDEGMLQMIDAGMITIPEFPSTHNLKNISLGGRYRFLFDPVDIGVMYYFGYFHDPGVTIKLDLNQMPPVPSDIESIQFTRYHFVGLASSYFFEPFTLALEGGMFFSEDTDGSDSSLYNSKLVYLAEVSYTNPNNSLFVALNYQGQMVLNYTPDPSLANPYLDVDAMAAFNGKAYQNNLTLAMEYPFMQEKLKLRIAGTYQVESMGYVGLGSLAYDLDDAVEVFAKSTLYGTFDENRAGLYNTWKENSQIQVGVRAWF
ncbi:MAG: hypothetical protein M0Q37_06150, partial [Sphaerochaeta sp.]|nr:hypothetical protein [Sphaerochaeta sp.]